VGPKGDSCLGASINNNQTLGPSDVWPGPRRALCRGPGPAVQGRRRSWHARARPVVGRAGPGEGPRPAWCHGVGPAAV